MIDFEKLLPEEIKNICSAIPPDRTRDYFKMNPREYQKLRHKKRGFRVQNLTPGDLTKILFANHRERFIFHFLKNNIESYISHVEEIHKEQADKGESSIKAYIYALANDFLNTDASLYFRLTNNKEFSEETVSVITEAAELCRREGKEFFKEKGRLEKDIGKLNDDISKKDSEIQRLAQSKDKLEKSIENELNVKIQLLEEDREKAKEEHDKLNGQVGSLNEKLENSRKSLQEERDKVKELQRTNGDLEKEKNKLKREKDDLERKYAAQQKMLDASRPETPRFPHRPITKDMGMFRDCLLDNFKSIGFDEEKKQSLLFGHLNRILFVGMPIVVNQEVAHTLAACVSNTLYGSVTPDVLLYTPGLSATHIKCFLEQSKRVVCLDGFLGNYNEMEILPIAAQFRDKIIFLTVTNERTIAYFNDDFMMNCIYLNLNRLGEFSRGLIPSADPATIDEQEVKEGECDTDEDWREFIEEIAEECQIPVCLTNKWAVGISSEEEFCQTLLFSLLPYCRDVLGQKPYPVSRLMDKYAGYQGKCGYKDVFLRWFER